MKTLALRLVTSGLLAAALGLSAAAEEKGKPEQRETARATPSIRVDHAVKPADLPALAKTTFPQALQTALARVPPSPRR